MNLIVTGASQGFGKEIVTDFVKRNYQISVCARDFDLLESTYKNSSVHYSKCDVSIENEVNDFLKFSLDKMKTVDVAVLNAAVYGPIGKVESVDIEQFRKAMDINFYGVLYFCRGLISYFKQNNIRGKIIVVSGGGASSPMPFFTSYAASKVAVVRLVESIAMEVEEYGIEINSIAPGPMATRMNQQVLDAGDKIVGSEFFKKNVKWSKGEDTNPQLAIELIDYLCHTNGINGKLISAKWDDWKNFDIDKLKNNDLYTLRRKV